MHEARLPSAFGGFPYAPRRSHRIRDGFMTPTNSFDILDIPQDFDALSLFLQVSCDTATRFVRLRWSADNGATFFTTGACGYVRDGASTVTQIISSDLAIHAAMSAASAFTGSILLHHYSDPNIPMWVEGKGSVDFTTAWTVSSADLFRYSPCNALRVIWNSTGVFDTIAAGVQSRYQLFGFRY